MTTRTVTAWIIYGTIIALIAVDTWLAINKTPGDTISELLLRWASKWPIIAFALGVVVGHIFWPNSVD